MFAEPFVTASLTRQRLTRSGVLLLCSTLALAPTIFVAALIAIELLRPFFHDGFAPSREAVLTTRFLAAVAIFGSVRQMDFHIRRPALGSAPVVAPIILFWFGLAFLLIVFMRLEYARVDLSVYFLATLVLATAAAFVRENAARYTFLTLPSTRPLPDELAHRMRLLLVSDPESELTGRVDGIIVDFNTPLSEQWSTFIAGSVLKGVPIYDRAEVIESFGGYVPADTLTQVAAAWSGSVEVYAVMKRLADLALCILLLPAIAVILLLSAIAIRLDSPGPIVFRQARVGYKGRQFTILKLRTMYAENSSRPVVNAVDADPRVTRVGRILRKWRIDELPQAFNILRGEMSWIGPRPETAELTSRYKEEVPLFIFRSRVRPGITGWAAVTQGYVGTAEEARKKLQYDLFYIKHLSFSLDLVIALRTIRVVLTGFKAR